MKIAILTSGILPVPAVQGGAVENLIDFYLDYNDRHRLHDITVYSVWHPAVKSHPALKSDVNHYRYVDTTSFWARVRRKLYAVRHKNEYYNSFIEYFFEEANKQMSRQHYDLVILENRPGYALKLSERGYSNIVLHLHNDLLNDDTPRARQTADCMAKVITVSDFIKDRVSTTGIAQKVQTVHNGIDLRQFTSQDSKVDVSCRSMGFAPDDFIIVFSGRINREKGISELIDAMKEVGETVPNAKLMVIGSSFFGNSTKDDEFMISLKAKAESLGKKIVFTGFIPYPLMPSYLRLAHIAVIPSMWDDPFPTTVLEAMAMGLPVIATRSGGIPEMCEGVGIIVERKNVVKHLVTTILDLYQHPEKRQAMSKAAHDKVGYFDCQRYSVEFFKAISSSH